MRAVWGSGRGNGEKEEFLISRNREREEDVRITDIDSVSQMNPGQYLAKGMCGPPFCFQDDL